MEPSDTRQVAIVTGGGQGIGRAIALCLARDAMNVVIADRQAEHAEVVSREVRATGSRALAVAVDVTAAPDRQHMVDATLAMFGRLDVLVNNARIVRAALPPGCG